MDYYIPNDANSGASSPTSQQRQQQQQQQQQKQKQQQQKSLMARKKKKPYLLAEQTPLLLPSPLETSSLPTSSSAATAAATAAAAVAAASSSPSPSSSSANPKGVFAYAGRDSNRRPMLSTQTVTTTTVTTTTVTNYPPLKLPRIHKQKLVQRDLYPLAPVPAPPSMQQFALEVSGQHLFFSQNHLVDAQDEDVVASIIDNINDDPSACASDIEIDKDEDEGDPLLIHSDVPRAMTPLYTQDDATKDAERQMRQMLHRGSPRSLTATATATAESAASSARRFAAAFESERAVRRSSSPPPSTSSSANIRHSDRSYGRNACSPSPPPQLHHHHLHRHHHNSHINRDSADQLGDIDAATVATLGTVVPETAAAHAAAAAVTASAGSPLAPDAQADDPVDDGVLPLPSPLLSPRARPESMDTDEILDHAHFGPPSHRQLRFSDGRHHDEISPPNSGRQSGSFDIHDGVVDFVAGSAAARNPFAVTSNTQDPDGMSRTTTRRSHEVSTQFVGKDMAALYSMPDILSTYDNLPSNMQTYLLYQLLRRTPRPALQFAAQTVLPVLHRDFIGGLPPEAAHHVLKFMDTRTLCRATCVSETWRRVIDGDRAVWRAKLVDAHYVSEVPRVHPLCHTYFGLGPEPTRPITHNPPTAAELSLAQLAPRRNAHMPTYPYPAPSHAGPGNPFKAQFARSYRLDRNWQANKCRQFSFLCDGGNVVTCVQLTEKYIIAGFDTKNIYVFDINTGETVRQLVGHEGGVWALSVVGNTVISGSTDRSVRVWDLESGKCTHVFAGHSSTVRCLQVLLPTDVRTSRERAMGMPVRYEPSEPLIITGSRDTTLRVWRLPSPKKDQPFHSQRPGALAARGASSQQQTPVPQTMPAAASSTVLGGEADNSHVDMMVIVDDEDNSGESLSATQSVGSSAQSMASTPLRAKPTSSSGSGPRTNPYFVRTFEGHSDSVRAVAGYGNMVVSGSYDCTIRVWDLKSGMEVHKLEGHTSKVYTIVLDPDQHLIFSGSMDGTIRVWNWDTGSCLRILRGHLTLVGLLALKHGTLVSAGADTTLRIWDHPMKEPPQRPQRQRPFSNIPGDVISGPPMLYASPVANPHHALAQNAGNLQQVHLLQQLQLQQRANDQLHQQQADTTADMIRHETHVLRQHTNAITCFQHDGTKIVSGADSTLKLWDVRTGVFVRDLLANLSSVWQVQFDKRRCVAAVNRNEVTYFEVMDFQ